MQIRSGRFETARYARAAPAWIATVALLSACGSDEAPPPAPAPAPIPQAKVEKAPEDPTARMARAVATSGAAAPFDVRYEIPTKPIVNQPVEMDLAILVATGADSLAIAYEPSPGLTVISEPPPAHEDVKPGIPVTTKLAVSADKPDVFYVTVAATIEAGGVPTTRNFAIPLIFSEAPAAAPESVEQPAEKAEEAPTK